jgi:protein gp37
MSGKTNIQWTNRTWNPLTGCSRVSSGCDLCYAFALHDMRHEAYENGKDLPTQYAKPFSEIQLFPQRLNDPLKIKAPTKFFVNSMSDMFHSQVPEEFIRQVFETMRKAHWHTFQILTKRAGRLRRLGQQLDWPANVWMGVSIELDSLTPRADALREVPAAVRFLSLEPLLGPLPSLNLEGIHWTITGGESGTGARPFDPDWARDIRERCADAGTAYFHKQMGSVWARQNKSRHSHGADPRDWPEDLRIQQFPETQKQLTLF